MSKLLVFLSLLGFGFAAPAFGQPDANPSLADDCDDTYATESDDEYICKQAQTAAQQAAMAAHNTDGEKWVCVEIVKPFPDQLDADGWITVEPLFDDHVRAIWLNMASLNRFDRLGEEGVRDVLLPPWAMRVSPVYDPHADTQVEQRNLSRIYRRLADDVCDGSPWAGHPNSIEIAPED